jgi:hypothetical protein
MKRCLFSVIAIAVVLLSVPSLIHAQKPGQPTTFSNAKPMTFAYNMKTYYLVQKNNLTNAANAAPEDKFWALPPGCTAESCRGEQSSIGAEVGHAADAQWRMTTIILTGKNPPAASLPGTVVLKMDKPTKAAMMDALKKSFDLMDTVVDNFDDAKMTAMVNSQHALQPFASTLFNTISHDREVYGRIVSFLASFNIKAPGEINASDPNNKEDLYYCGGQSSKDMSICK